MNTQVDAEVGGVPRILAHSEDPKGLGSPHYNLTHPGVPHARVGMTVGTQYDFGRIKVTAHVELECDQLERAIERAGELAFTKALELMTDGMNVLLAEEKS